MLPNQPHVHCRCIWTLGTTLSVRAEHGRCVAGGQTIGKKKKKSKKQPAEGEEGAEGAEGGDGAASQKYVAPDEHTEIATKVKTGQTYEEEFASEIERAKEGKLKSTPWGSSFGKAPDILHGGHSC